MEDPLCQRACGRIQRHELYFWHGWQVSKATVMEEPTAERILKEENLTEREVLIQRMGVENFVREAELQQVDSFRENSLFKVNTAEKRSRYQDGNGLMNHSPSLSSKSSVLQRRRLTFSVLILMRRPQSKHSNRRCPDTAATGRDLVKET